MNVCPACQFQLTQPAESCPRCQIIFSKWKPRDNRPATRLAAELSEPSFQYAGFWPRLLAFAIDGASVNAAAYIALTGLATVGIEIGKKSPLYSLVFIIVQWLYFAGFESSEQATPGKKAMGLKVVDLAGNPISFQTATIRYFSKILSMLPLCAGFIMAGYTKKKQALHDIIAGTLVVLRV